MRSFSLSTVVLQAFVKAQARGRVHLGSGALRANSLTPHPPTLPTLQSILARQHQNAAGHRNAGFTMPKPIACIPTGLQQGSRRVSSLAAIVRSIATSIHTVEGGDQARPNTMHITTTFPVIVARCGLPEASQDQLQYCTLHHTMPNFQNTGWQ